MDRELWKLENYRGFLEARRLLLADELNKFLAGITETAETEMETSIEDLVAEGESSELEFKASLRWDYREGEIELKLEKVVLKTIAAFSNADGGTLLIGVSEDGEILGLEADYSSLRGHRDEFKLHIRNLINKSYGKVFATNNLKMDFHVLGESEVCRIEVKRGEKAIYLETADKYGMKTKKFYVRSGNSSQELQIDEAHEYVKSRFNNS